MSVAEEIDRVLAETEEADEALRAVVALLAAPAGVAWAAIAFIEEGKLLVGPAAGVEEPARRHVAAVTFNGEPVGEIRVDGEVDPSLLAHVAAAVSTHVLVGWDTGGAGWDP